MNSRGGVGHNISCDLHMEHLNRALKTALSGLGANVSQGSTARASKCLKVVTDVTANFDNAAGVPFVSEKHSEASYRHDLSMICKNCTPNPMFSITSQRGAMHHFATSTVSCSSLIGKSQNHGLSIMQRSGYLSTHLSDLF